MRVGQTVGATLLVAGLLGTACTKQTGAQTVAEPPASQDEEIESLIGDLQEVGDPTAGAHPTTFICDFVATTDQPAFGGGIIGSEPPTVHPSMRRLVQLGLQAMPALIDHLSDERETKLVIEHGRGMGAIWHAESYSPRYRDPELWPEDLNMHPYGRRDGYISEYTIRVGDLCYVVIGQIVNRNLMAVQYVPTGNQAISSPVTTPSLIEAVESEWAGLSRDEHIEHLESDAYFHAKSGAEAVKRLLYYYPEEGERVAIKLLNRDLYEQKIVWDFVQNDFKHADSPKEWHRLYEKAHDLLGDITPEVLPLWSYWPYGHFTSDEDEDERRKGRWERLRKTLFPEFTQFKSIFISVVDPEDQGFLIEALHGYESAEIDSAVQDAVREAIAFKPKHESTQAYRDILILNGLERMVGKGFDDEYEKHIRSRLAELEKLDEESIGWRLIEGLRYGLELLEGRQD